ncbi:Isonitrile hydratase [Carnimonas sp. R-84981]|uniref:DJ-1/PfpI family protein n=1 Tax=Carnimonas bestiolae TaxID=3402172 RepID=UPI003EDB9123
MKTVVIPLYAGVTHLDFTGPHQFLAKVPELEVIVVSAGGVDIASDGLTFSQLSPLEEIEHCDVLFIPGGVGCVDALENPSFLASIQRLGNSAEYLTSVCTGSLILGAAGFLDGRRAACHWAWKEMLTAFGAIPDAKRVVRDGNIITGGGVTAGIDFVLTLIAELFGEDKAQFSQLLLEYSPEPPFNAGTPDSAPSRIYDAVWSRLDPTLSTISRRIKALEKNPDGLFEHRQ